MSTQNIPVFGDAADSFRSFYKINDVDEARQKRAQKDQLWYEPNPWRNPALPRPNREAFDWAADEVVRRFLSGRYQPQKSPQQAKHFSQGNKVATRQNGSFKAVSSTPNVCKTPCGPATPPVPYPVIADLAGSTGVVSNVRFNGKPAYTLNKSVVPTCTGDEAGCAMGVKSGTVGAEVKPTGGSNTVRVGGNPVIRDGDPCTMNNGNCTGTYVTAPTPSGSIGPDGKVVGNANPPPDKGVMGQVGGFLEGAGGALWDMGKGVAHLAVGAAKLTPMSQAAEGVSKLTGWYDYHGYTDTQNAVRNTAQAIYNNPKAIVDGITKPYIEAWNQGNYGEALGRGAVDVGGLFAGGVGAVGKAGEAGEVLNAAGKAGEAAETANAVTKAGEVGEGAAQTGKVAEVAETGPAGDGLKIAGPGSEVPTTAAGSRYQEIVSQIRGKILSHSDALTPGPLGDDLAGLPGTFSGGRYATIRLDEPLTAYRAWTPGQSRELGAFWSLEEPTGSLQTRIDSALLPEWGSIRGTPFSAQASQYTIIQMPAETVISIGEVGSQGGAWIGGGSQLLIDGGAQESWKIGGAVLK